MLASLPASRVEGLTAAYGEDTGPNMSKTFPMGFKFSSTTASPILGTLSVFVMMFRLGLIWRTRPSRCKFLNSPRKSMMLQRSRLFKLFYVPM